MKPKRYQLVLLGPEKALRQSELQTEVHRLFTSIGLDFGTDAELLVGAEYTPDWTSYPVALWFGGNTAPKEEVEMLREFRGRGFAVFPVMETLDNYSHIVPEELVPINGEVWDAVRVASDVMKAFRLSRRVRQVFISYKRSESSGVAHQLFHELNERGFCVFLDTASVQAGADFQKSLWGRMADVDLMVLLDTPTALDSTWVHQELNRAHDLGMGVVQLIWPGHSRTTGTEFCEPVALGGKDFVGGDFSPKGELERGIIQSVMAIFESERIRSLNTRRIRIMDELQDLLKGTGGTIAVQPRQNVELRKGTDKIAEIIPFVGVPDAFSLFEHDTAKPAFPKFVVFNGLGVDEEWNEHLRWLNGKIQIGVHPIDDFGTCIRGII